MTTATDLVITCPKCEGQREVQVSTAQTGIHCDLGHYCNCGEYEVMEECEFCEGCGQVEIPEGSEPHRDLLADAKTANELYAWLKEDLIL